MLKRSQVAEKQAGSPVKFGGFGVWAVAALTLGLTAVSGSQEHFATKEGDKALEAGTGPTVTGYIQYHFNYPIGGNAEHRFRVQRARVGVEGRVNSRITYEVDIDPRAPDHSGTLRDAFFNVELNKNHTLRLGQHKAKFGFINQRSSSRLYRVNRPELADELARGINLRDIGVTIMGKGPKGSARLEYALSVVNGAGMNVQRDNNSKKNLSGRVGLYGKKGSYKWRLGASASHGDKFETSNNPKYANGGYYIRFNRAGTDLYLDHNRFDLYGEYAIGRQRDRGSKETLEGYYLTLVGKTSRSIGPVLSYDSMNHTENVRVVVGGYYGERNEPFRVLMNYEFRGAVESYCQKLWIWRDRAKAIDGIKGESVSSG